MLRIYQTLLIISLFFFTSISWASNEAISSEDLAEIGSLVVSQPEKALISIEKIRKNNAQLTTAQRVMLIKHEVIANTYLNHHKLALDTVE